MNFMQILMISLLWKEEWYKTSNDIDSDAENDYDYNYCYDNTVKKH